MEGRRKKKKDKRKKKVGRVEAARSEGESDENMW